jgi:hypothetical protein
VELGKLSRHFPNICPHYALGISLTPKSRSWIKMEFEYFRPKTEIVYKMEKRDFGPKGVLHQCLMSGLGAASRLV